MAAPAPDRASDRVVVSGDWRGQVSACAIDEPARGGTLSFPCMHCALQRQDGWRVPATEHVSELHRRLNDTSAALAATFSGSDGRHRRVRLTGNDLQSLALGFEEGEDLLR